MPTVFVEVTLAGLGTLTPRSVLVLQAENSHDVASFTTSAAGVPERLRELTPLSIKWGYAAGNQQNFFGYVHHTEPLYVDNEQRMKVVCIGSSLPLRSAIQRTWRYQSYDTIVREIAADVYLSADVEPHDTVWPYTAASGSAWDLLLELAGKIGYVLAVNGTEIRFISPIKLVEQNITSAPALQLDLFRPIVGLMSEEGDRLRRGYGIDARTGRLYSATAGLSDAPMVMETDIVSTSPGEVTAHLTGIDQRNVFRFRADAECRGEAKLVQGSLVYVSGVGPDYAGHWYVHQVEHEIQGGEYRNYLRLGRRTRTPLPSFTRPGQPMRLRTDPFGEVTGNPPPTVLTNGVWRSGWARRAS
jgi:hypothetical protein